MLNLRLWTQKSVMILIPSLHTHTHTLDFCHLSFACNIQVQMKGYVICKTIWLGQEVTLLGQEAYELGQQSKASGYKHGNGPTSFA